MTGMGQEPSLDRNGVHELRQTSLGSIEDEVILNRPNGTQDEWHECLGTTTPGAGPSGKVVEGSLSFLSVKTAVRDYPDTGESGDAYDAEVFR